MEKYNILKIENQLCFPLYASEKAVSIPEAVGSCVDLTPEEMSALYHLLYKILGKEIPKSQ